MKLSYIACDRVGCAMTFELEDRSKTTPGIILRRAAWKAGWWTDDSGQDFCPTCAAQIKKDKAACEQNK
jgi:hypothetical protein